MIQIGIEIGIGIGYW